MFHHTLLAQRSLHHVLSRYTRVVGSRQPQYLFTVHPRLAGKDILNCVI